MFFETRLTFGRSAITFMSGTGPSQKIRGRAKIWGNADGARQARNRRWYPCSVAAAFGRCRHRLVVLSGQRRAPGDALHDQRHRRARHRHLCRQFRYRFLRPCRLHGDRCLCVGSVDAKSDHPKDSVATSAGMAGRDGHALPSGTCDCACRGCARRGADRHSRGAPWRLIGFDRDPWFPRHRACCARRLDRFHPRQPDLFLVFPARSISGWRCPLLSLPWWLRVSIGIRVLA